MNGSSFLLRTSGVPAGRRPPRPRAHVVSSRQPEDDDGIDDEERIARETLHFKEYLVYSQRYRSETDVRTVWRFSGCRIERSLTFMSSASRYIPNSQETLIDPTLGVQSTDRQNRHSGRFLFTHQVVVLDFQMFEPQLEACHMILEPWALTCRFHINWYYTVDENILHACTAFGRFTVCHATLILLC